MDAPTADDQAALRAAIRKVLGLPSEGTQMDVVSGEGLWTLAGAHSIRSLVAAAGLRSADSLTAPEDVRAQFTLHARRAAMRNLQLASACDQLARRATDAGIRVAVLKGLALAATAYRALGLREMVDVDLLVERHRVRETLDVLRTMGFTAARAFDLDVDMAIAHHATAFVKDGCAIEVHWELADPSWAIALRADDAWRRAVPLSLAGAELWRLCNEDSIVHVCFHAISGHDLAIGIRPLVDLAAILTRHADSIDWPLVHRISADAGATRAVALMLALTTRVIGLDIPAEASPAPCPIEVIEIAEQVIWRGAPHARLKTTVARTRGTTLGGRIGHMLRRVFIPRADLARRYGVSPHSRFLPILYGRRAADLLVEYGPTLARGRDPRWHDADQRAVVRSWAFPRKSPL